MLSHPLSTHVVSYLNSPSFSDLVLHTRPLLLDSLIAPSPLLELPPTPNLHNSNINPLRHSQSLTLPPPSLSPSLSHTAASLSPSPSLAAFTLDEEQRLYAHRVILAGRSPFWHRLLSSPLSSFSSASFLYPALSAAPLLSVVSASPSVMHLAMVVHADVLFLLMKFVYSGKADLSFLDRSAASTASPGSSIEEDAPSFSSRPFAPEMLALSAESPMYQSVVVQQMLFYARLFELQSLYSTLTVHCCTAAPRALQLHLHTMAAVKADAPPSSAASLAIPILSGNKGRTRFSSSPFLSSAALHYGHHDAARGVHVRIRVQHEGRDADEDGVVTSERLTYDGVEWRRYKVDPLLFACRSAFFSAMFGADWKENQLQVDAPCPSPSSSPNLDVDVVLQDCSPAEFEQLVQFLYTDEMAIAAPSPSTALSSAQPPFLRRSFQHLAIINPWTLRLMDESAAFTHLVSLMSLSVLYAIPSMLEYLQHVMAQHITAEAVCAVWPLVLNPFFSPSSAQQDDDAVALDDAFAGMATMSDAACPSPAPPPLFTELDILHDACLQYACQHFLRISHQPSFLSLPLSLLKQTLDPGNVECDSSAMIEALERWIDHAVRSEGLKDVQEVSARKAALRATLHPPSTLFNSQEKRKVMNGDRAFFTRLGVLPRRER